MGLKVPECLKLRVNKEKKERKNIIVKNVKYEEIRNKYVTKEQAVFIANNDRNLKDSIYKKWKEDGLILGWISFNSFDVGLVQYNNKFAWHVKIKSGEWGAYFDGGHMDGEFNSESGSCLIMCSDGEYIFEDEVDFNKVKAANNRKYEVFAKQNVIK